MEPVPTTLWQFFMSLDPGMRFPLLIVLIVFGTTGLVALVGIVAHTIKTIHQSRLDDALKRELLDRGMSADEIALMIRATPSATDAEQPGAT